MIKHSILLLAVFSGLQANAASYTCQLALGSVISNDSSFALPKSLAVSFGSQGESITLANSEFKGLLNCTLPGEDKIKGAHIFFGASGVEGLFRETDIVALSPQAFLMTVSGKDKVTQPSGSTERTWSGNYACLIVSKPIN